MAGLKVSLTLFLHPRGMNFVDVPLFGMLKSRMGYLTQRQQVVAQNVANASTPGFMPQDLKPFTLKPDRLAMRPVAPTMTSPMHLAGAPAPSDTGYKPEASPDTEATLDGNQVVLEEQMMKLTQARLDYDAAVGFYQQSLNLLRTAAKAPGR